jgi:hypothetical protein
MVEERAERRLAAIPAADVVGYSRLIGADEEGTLTATIHPRRITDPKITEQRGRIVKTTVMSCWWGSAVLSMGCVALCDRVAARHGRAAMPAHLTPHRMPHWDQRRRCRGRGWRHSVPQSNHTVLDQAFK